MCVGLPAKIVTMKDGMAVVDASGAKREISTELLENVEPGDYVMVHAGIAIAKIQEDEEEEADELLEELL
ncbi:MAG TPA: HypC/HybG/HupF family hydrogenase formation chaperone [Candidatus Anaerobutyricum stercoripullorum]|uniref:HypC/HybG/HupF family hydrogenase formation chaperone n=1 Tax=Candidatus Anaerobutyricum stercoripullorum TaxID=2838456 RepID=A0A9D1X3U7_9FIRM|nr:HypC/HybG/HupF family hydrogenase formation chaperone [Candidatus Anaerobutyricum stercoripullorum]